MVVQTTRGSGKIFLSNCESKKIDFRVFWCSCWTGISSGNDELKQQGICERIWEIGFGPTQNQVPNLSTQF